MLEVGALGHLYLQNLTRQMLGFWFAIEALNQSTTSPSSKSKKSSWIHGRRFIRGHVVFQSDGRFNHDSLVDDQLPTMLKA